MAEHRPTARPQSSQQSVYRESLRRLGMRIAAKTSKERDMAMTDIYTSPEPDRTDIDARQGPLVLEFGAPWCGFCKAAQPLIAQAFQGYAGIPHIKVEDGKGRPLGRSFRIKLWPSLIFLHNGQEVSRLVRPDNAEAIERELARLSTAA